MLLVDSSVWIDFFNGVANPQADFLDRVLGTEPIVVGDIIIAEVLQGFRADAHFRQALTALRAFPVVALVGEEIAIASASNFRALRKRGITIRKTTDALIATYCISNHVSLLHRDRDFEPFVRHLGLTVPRLDK